jgi:hypothetical protein
MESSSGFILPTATVATEEISVLPDCHASRAVNSGGKEGTEQSCADASGEKAADAATKRQKRRWYTTQVIKVKMSVRF